MTLPSLRSATAAEIEEAWRWYESRHEGSGDEFLGVVGEGQVVVVACFHVEVGIAGHDPPLASRTGLY